MNFSRTIVTIIVTGLIIFVTGCISQERYDIAMSQNRTQAERIVSLDSQLNDAKMKLKAAEKRLEELENISATGISAKNAEIEILKKDIEDKKALIEKMRAQLLRPGLDLPPELSIALQEFAKTSDMIVFDEETGILKFKSDFLFRSGSADVADDAKASVAALSKILNSEAGKPFDVIIAGYTDNDPIKHSMAQHPTNWHLSSHRAIGVLTEMEKAGVESARLSARGFGEFRPIGPNDDPKGKAANRRVEIYIVPKGV